MAILRTRTEWQRPRPTRTTAQPDDLTSEEQANVRSALAFLRVRLGSWLALAEAMGVKVQTLKQAAKRKRRGPTAGHALRAARVARVCAEMILTGSWPPNGACPHCGRM
jgi:hypothetical protein